MPSWHPPNAGTAAGCRHATAACASEAGFEQFGAAAGSGSISGESPLERRVLLYPWRRSEVLAGVERSAVLRARRGGRWTPRELMGTAHPWVPLTAEQREEDQQQQQSPPQQRRAWVRETEERSVQGSVVPQRQRLVSTVGLTNERMALLARWHTWHGKLACVLPPGIADYVRRNEQRRAVRSQAILGGGAAGGPPAPAGARGMGDMVAEQAEASWRGGGMVEAGAMPTEEKEEARQPGPAAPGHTRQEVLGGVVAAEDGLVQHLQPSEAAAAGDDAGGCGHTPRSPEPPPAVAAAAAFDDPPPPDNGAAAAAPPPSAPPLPPSAQQPQPQPLSPADEDEPLSPPVDQPAAAAGAAATGGRRASVPLVDPAARRALARTLRRSLLSSFPGMPGDDVVVSAAGATGQVAMVGDGDDSASALAAAAASEQHGGAALLLGGELGPIEREQCFAAMRGSVRFVCGPSSPPLFGLSRFAHDDTTTQAPARRFSGPLQKSAGVLLQSNRG
jgi:hypothetical protein